MFLKNPNKSLYEYALHLSRKYLKETHPNDYIDLAHDAYIYGISSNGSNKALKIYRQISKHKKKERVIFEELPKELGCYEYNLEISVDYILNNIKIDEKEKEIFRLYCADDLSLEKISNKYNLSREKIKRIIRITRMKMEKFICKKKNINPIGIIPSKFNKYLKIEINGNGIKYRFYPYAKIKKQIKIPVILSEDEILHRIHKKEERKIKLAEERIKKIKEKQKEDEFLRTHRWSRRILYNPETGKHDRIVSGYVKI